MMAGVTRTFDDLGYYTLAGAPKSPRDLIDEARDGERLGFGWAFISERLNVKEAATLSGALAVVSTTMRIATAATHHNTRHPLVTAAYATTMHRLTGGRFTLGLGRGIAPMTRALGLAPVTTAQLEDFAGLMRRLWHGETIVGHDGPAGQYPFLRLDATFDEDIGLGLTAFGPNSLRLAGRAFDQVVLHTFFDDDTLIRCVRTVKDEAKRVGRDPEAIKVWSCLATIGDHLPEPDRLKKTVGPHGDVSAGVRRSPGAHEWLGPGTAGTLPRRSVRRGLPGRDRPAGNHGRARARRDAHPRGVAADRGDGHPFSVRGGDPVAVRPRCRRRHPPRRFTARARTDRRSLGSRAHHGRRAVTSRPQ
jgi:alkanesulfonate monooxygenase SsuD/methylene tetrahydromethanopterin reductase-like flavin-dependent oxidoreductase (luciferase family)